MFIFLLETKNYSLCRKIFKEEVDFTLLFLRVYVIYNAEYPKLLQNCALTIFHWGCQLFPTWSSFPSVFMTLTHFTLTRARSLNIHSKHLQKNRYIYLYHTHLIIYYGQSIERYTARYKYKSIKSDRVCASSFHYTHYPFGIHIGNNVPKKEANRYVVIHYECDQWTERSFVCIIMDTTLFNIVPA